MAADDAARSRRRMDLNLYLGLPRAARTQRPDLGSNLALGNSMLSSSPSSSAASVDAPPPEAAAEPLHPPYSPTRPTPPRSVDVRQARHGRVVVLPSTASDRPEMR